MMTAAAKLHSSKQPALVVGLGLTGWSVVRFLRARDESVVVTDTREAPPFLDQMREVHPEVSFVVDLPTDEYDKYREIIASPGLSVSTGHVIGDIELFAREATAPIIGITGSNGKSTVTTLLGEMLTNAEYSVLVGGNIGTPALDLLDLPIPDFYILELSSFQLETTSSLSPCAAVVLNISEDHMDRYTNVSEYAQAKFHIYDSAGCRVVNRDDKYVRQNLETSGALSFGLDQGTSGHYGLVNDAGKKYFAKGRQKLVPVTDLVLQGQQNMSNVLAAMALVECAGLELSKSMIEAAMKFKGLPHRCELVGAWEEVRWINDSKGTNVGATLAAIKGVEGSVILIAGGQGKGADFRSLATEIDKSVKAVVLFGEDASIISGAINSQHKVKIAASLSHAIELAADQSETGDTVLFSPACASFDMFDSYEHRGDAFRKLVNERHRAQ
ncbi:MAG: UDP-N-acetylmuramoyl-L-alanine--D-glutamate ligase [bacterium]